MPPARKVPTTGNGPKSAKPRRSADASEGASKAAKANEFRKFGEYLRATDVSGKGRSATAARRQAELNKAVTDITAKKLGGYAGRTTPPKPKKKSASQIRAEGIKEYRTSKATGSSAEARMDAGSRRWRLNPDGSRTNRVSNIDVNVPAGPKGKARTRQFGDKKTRMSGLKMSDANAYMWPHIMNQVLTETSRAKKERGKKK